MQPNPTAADIFLIRKWPRSRHHGLRKHGLLAPARHIVIAVFLYLHWLFEGAHVRLVFPRSAQPTSEPAFHESAKQSERKATAENASIRKSPSNHGSQIVPKYFPIISQILPKPVPNRKIPSRRRFQCYAREKILIKRIIFLHAQHTHFAVFLGNL